MVMKGQVETPIVSRQGGGFFSTGHLRCHTAKSTWCRSRSFEKSAPARGKQPSDRRVSLLLKTLTADFFHKLLGAGQGLAFH